MTISMPGATDDLAQQHADIWSAFSSLGKACTLTDREKRLVKPALAIGVACGEAVYSHTRRARSEGIADAALHQVTFRAIDPLGLPRAGAAGAWIEDREKA